MKKLILTVFIISVIFSCDNTEPLPPDTYEITASAPGIYNGMRAYLKTLGTNKRLVVTDTAMVVDEQFTFKGERKHASFYYLTINGVRGNLDFILEPGKMKINIYKDSLRKSLIEGSRSNELYRKFKESQESLLEQMKDITSRMRDRNNRENTELQAELLNERNALNESLKQSVFEFIEKHPDSDFSLILLENAISRGNDDLEQIKRSLALLQPIIDNNPAYYPTRAKIDETIKTLEARANLEIGKIAPNFSSFTPDGEPLALNDIKGKATIIDFWAAWCGPCRRENPNVVKVYETYHDKGLEIIGISLDGTSRQQDPKGSWLKAIEQDKLTWHHVSSLSYFNDPVAKLYNINSIPATFILDEEGRIVAKNLRGNALEQQIASMLD
jgi:peroxiredoxin